MDFVVGWSRTPKQYDFIWVVVDRFIKSARFILIKSTYWMEYYAMIFIDNIVYRYGIPLSIILDRVHNSYLDFRRHSKKGWVTS